MPAQALRSGRAARTTGGIRHWVARLCARLTQGSPEGPRRRATRLAQAGGVLLASLAWGAAAAPATDCGAPLRLQPLHAGVWLVPGLASPTGEPDAANRGQVGNLLAVADGDRLWLIGSGPSPAFGRRLACELRRQLGRELTDAVAPWANPEFVLGQSGFGPEVRLHAHRAVAEAMRERCPECVDRLRVALGDAAADLDGAPVRLPDVLFGGDRGRLGPFDWQAASRGQGQVVTVWRVRGTPWRSAPGLLWGDGPPDGRGAELQVLAASTGSVANEAGPAARWVPSQGPVLPGVAARAHLRYWLALMRAAEQGVARGGTEAPAPPASGGPPSWDTHLRHRLNWQRAWRQALDRAMDAPPQR